MKELANGLDKLKCTGCTACVEICPNKCIKMVEDEHGFFYPIKDSKLCINCGLCKKVCPILNNIVKTTSLFKQKVYALESNNEKLVLKSSSGGAFSTIAEAFCKQGDYYIFGARFDENLNVIHDYISNIKDIEIFRKSKYVQSNLRNSYSLVEKFLKDNKKVLFTGTPCQIAGLKSYLGRDYDNLLLVDLVCHGVPSQKIFDMYIQEIEKKYNKKVKFVQFREKVKMKNGRFNSRNIKLVFNNDKVIIEDSLKNAYLRGFQNALFYRSSCGKCQFANPNRLSDITIADCWGIQNIYKDIDVHKGISMVVVNTKKGGSLINEFYKKCKLKELDIDFAIKNNAQFSSPAKFHKNRNYFFENFEKIDFSKLVNKCVKVSKTKQLLRKLSPSFIKNIYKKLNKRIDKNEK